uniref:Uncharacterized protein n=1 Tax=Ananas comosus var. bracteatus TaxID=296719 RepID=A0A6V7QJA3_ANACO|nr:unnamed protein product [Ananas comosus var. bracteatus]
MLVLGTGFVGRYAPERLIEHEDEEGEAGWRVSGTCATAAKKIELEKIGMDAFIFDATKSKYDFLALLLRAFRLLIIVQGTAAGGTTEIVVHGSTGLLHPAGKDSILPLGQNMVKLATRVDQRLTMGKKGYEGVKERFMGHYMSERISSVLKQVLQKSEDRTHS